MAKKSSILRNKKVETMSKMQQSKRAALKKISKDTNLPMSERLEAQIKLSQLPRNGSFTRYRNRCSMTGRPRGNLRKFQLSRIMFRDLASWGQVPGVVKSSW